MPLSDNKLIAWVAPNGAYEYEAAFRAAGVPTRAPATQMCSSKDEARQWVEDEAAALDVPVAWVWQPGAKDRPTP